MAKTSGLPLGLIWKDQAIDHPPQPYPIPVACSITQISATGNRGQFRFNVTAGTSVGVMKLVFNTGNFLLPSNGVGGGNGNGPCTSPNPMADRMKWSHGTYSNQDAGSSISGNFYVNDSSGLTDVPVIAVDTQNTTSSSNLEKVKQIGLLGGEKFMLSVNGTNKINSVNHLRGSVPKAGSHNIASGQTYTFGQDANGVYSGIPLYEYDASLNSGAGGFAQMVVNGVNQTTTLGPYDGWINRNSGQANNTLTPGLYGADAVAPIIDGDFYDIEDVWTTEANNANLMKPTPGGALSVSQEHQYWPSFHASRNTVYCVPIIPNNISDGDVTITVEAPLQGTWFGVAVQCPVDLETADSGNHKLNRSSIQDNWNQTCNQGGVSNTIYHMPIDGFGTVNPASVGRDENGIPIKTKMNHSPALDNYISNSSNKFNDRVVSEHRTSASRVLWETLVTYNYITRNSRSSWKTAMANGTDPDTLLRYWYGMRDSAKCSGSFSFPASDQITCPTFSAATGAPSGAAAVPEVGDLVVTGSDNTFGNNGTASNVTVTAVSGQTITVSSLSSTTQAAMTGLSDPIVTFVRMGDIQTQGYLNPTTYNSGNAVDAVDELTGQPNGDIGIRDYLFEDRYGATPVGDGFYKVVDKNGVDNGNGGKKRIKIKDGIIIKCRNCFGSIKNR